MQVSNRYYDNSFLPEEFHLKSKELIALKLQANTTMTRLNALNCEYRDWYNNRYQVFLDTIKGIHIIMPNLVPSDIYTIHQYKETVDLGEKLFKLGHFIRSIDNLYIFQHFWDRFCYLKDEVDTYIVAYVEAFCSSITRLRDQRVKEELSAIDNELKANYSEYFNFKDIHNAKDNLYTYKLMVADQMFLGLVGYIPYLVQKATRICYLVGRLHLEKE